MNHDYATDSDNTLNITNSNIHGSITSKLPFGYWSITPASIDPVTGAVTPRMYNGYTYDNGTTITDTNWYDGDVFTLNISNSTIDDDYEALYFTDTYLSGDDGTTTKTTNESFYTALGVAVDLNVESNINIANNSRVAGIALSQGIQPILRIHPSTISGTIILASPTLL